MSQIASNSVRDKPTSIFIFALIILIVSHQTSGIPAGIPTAYENVKHIIQPEESSSYWGLADMLSYGVKSIQNVIKFVIGVNEHQNEHSPREFYLVRIRDKKNPGKYTDVWRERGQGRKDNDIPTDGGKLPENSLIVNAENPVTEYVSSPESASPPTTSLTTASHEKDEPVVEKIPQNENNGQIKVTNGEHEDSVPAANPPREKNTVVKSPIPSAETQVPSKELIADDKPVRSVTAGNNPTEQDPKHTKSGNVPQIGQTDTDLGIDQDYSQVGLSQNSDPASLEQKNTEFQKLIQQLPNVEKLILPLLKEETHTHEHNNSSDLAQNDHTTDPISNKNIETPKITQPAPVQTSEHVTPKVDEFPNKQHDEEIGNCQNLKHPPKIEETQPPSGIGGDSNIPPESESSSFDPNQLTSLNKCEVEFEKNFCEKNLAICQQFQSDGEFIAFVKENSDCSSEVPQVTDSAAGGLDHSQELPLSHNTNNLSSMNECEKAFKEKLCQKYYEFCEDSPSKEVIDYIKTYSKCSSEEQQIINSPADNHDSPESLSKNTNDLSLMNECEKDFKEALCREYSEFCEDSPSKEVIDYIKTNSECSSEEQQIINPSTDGHGHSSESLSNDTNDLSSMNECEKNFKEKLCREYSEFCEDSPSEEVTDYIKTNSECSSEEQQITDPAADHPDHSTKSPSYNPNDFISMNECETNFEKKLCGEHPEFCQHFKSKEEFINYVKIYSGCSTEEQENYQNHATDHGAEIGEEDPSYLEDQPHDLESSGNFDGPDANDHRIDESSNPHFEHTQTITQKKSTKKKLKSKKRSKSNA